MTLRVGHTEIARPPEQHPGNDPYRVPAHAPRWVVGASLAVAAWGLCYLTWRVTATSSGANLGLFIPLLVAELILWLRFAVTTMTTRTAPQPIELPDSLPGATTDIVITTLNDPIEWIRMSLVAARAVHGVDAVWIFDDGNRTEVADLAERLGARYVCRQTTAGARAGNLNAALTIVRSDRILFLSAGDIAMPDAVIAASQRFDDREVAVVQLGSHHWNRSAMDRTGPGRNDRAYVNEVIRPADDAHGAAVWLDGPSLIRRSDVSELGSFSSDSPLPELNAGVRLQQHGMRIRFHAETLVETPGPRNVQAAIVLEERRAQSVIASFARGPNPLLTPGLTFRQRLAYLHEFLMILGSGAVTIAATVLVITLLSGQPPIGGDLVPFVMMWAPWAIGATFGRVALSARRLSPGETFQRDLRYLGAHLRALSTALSAKPTYRYLDRETAGPQGMAIAGQVPVLAGLLLAMLAAISVQLAAIAFDLDLLPTLSGPTAIGAYVAAALFAHQAAIVLGMLVRTPEDADHRSDPGVLMHIGGRSTPIRRLTPFAATVEAGTGASAGQEFPVTILLPGADGSTNRLDLHARVTSTRPSNTSRHRIAVLQFESVTVEQRDVLIEYCYVARAVEELRGRIPSRRRPRWLAEAGLDSPQPEEHGRVASEAWTTN